MLIVSTVNIYIASRHKSLAKFNFYKSDHESFTLSMTWKNVDGPDTVSPISISGSGDDKRSSKSILRPQVPHHQHNDPKHEEKKAEHMVEDTIVHKDENHKTTKTIDITTKKDTNKVEDQPGKDKVDAKNEDNVDERSTNKNQITEENNNNISKDKETSPADAQVKYLRAAIIISLTAKAVINSGTNPTTASSSFVRQDHVVIATKIHGEHQWSLLIQSMCLFHYAYNHKVLYDIVAFSTEPISKESIEAVQAMVAPAKFRLVVDNKGLQEEFATRHPDKQKAFLERCNVTSPANLTWFSECSGNRLAYNWQAEFRALYLWHHPSLAEYKTMVWLDTDGFATKPWKKDPVEYFIQNDGVIMFDHFPQAKSKYWVQRPLFKGFGNTICKLELSEETGNLVSTLGDGTHCRERGVPNIHGFFHITNMDFYRSEPVRKGLAALFDHFDCFLCREPDDQLAVTAPAAILAPKRSWEMRSKGFRLNVFHNYKLDGIDQAVPAGFKQYWNKVVQHTAHPYAAEVCQITESS